MGKKSQKQKSNEIKSLVWRAEDDMLKVYDLALIVHAHMSENAGISPDMQNALSCLTSDLVTLGERLKSHHAAMFAAAVEVFQPGGDA